MDACFDHLATCSGESGFDKSCVHPVTVISVNVGVLSRRPPHIILCSLEWLTMCFDHEVKGIGIPKFECMITLINLQCL